MRKIREVLRLKFCEKRSQREIAAACGMGAGTVWEYVKRATQVGLSWPLPEELDDAALDRKLYEREYLTAVVRPLPDFAKLHVELRRDGVTLQLLWTEYRESHPEGYGYSQFCERYSRWAQKLNPTMRQTHRAGEKAYVDFSGSRPHITDRVTGERTPVELFVGVLGASSLIYAEAVPSQELPNWIRVHTHMLEAWGGCPEILVPDNLKSGVTRPDRYEPDINWTYSEFAEFYGAVVIPARVRKPRDKAKVEVSVQVVGRWVVARLRNRTFFGVADLNQAIREQLSQLNERPMRHLGASRRELFERIDRPALRPLPVQRYELGEWKGCRASIDYHVEVDHNYYSVPYALFGERLEARFTATTVEVFYKSKRITSHVRLFGRGRYSTKPEHMPSSHRAHADWTPSRIIAWANKTGPAAGRVVARIMIDRPHPEQGFRSCMGIQGLGKKFGAERLEAACVRAERLGSPCLKTVKNILGSKVEQLPLELEAPEGACLPTHPNIRGASYYAGAIKED
jgi:transposase